MNLKLTYSTLACLGATLVFSGFSGVSGCGNDDIRTIELCGTIKNVPPNVVAVPTGSSNWNLGDSGGGSGTSGTGDNCGPKTKGPGHGKGSSDGTSDPDCNRAHNKDNNNDKGGESNPDGGVTGGETNGDGNGDGHGHDGGTTTGGYATGPLPGYPTVATNGAVALKLKVRGKEYYFVGRLRFDGGGYGCAAFNMGEAEIDIDEFKENGKLLMLKGTGDGHPWIDGAIIAHSFDHNGTLHADVVFDYNKPVVNDPGQLAMYLIKQILRQKANPFSHDAIEEGIAIKMVPHKPSDLERRAPVESGFRQI